MRTRFLIPPLIVLVIGQFAFGELKKDIEYAKVDGESLKLDVSTPDGAGPFPIALIVHGGGWSGGDKAQDITPLFDVLNQAGFVWISINYRLAPAHRWPACFEDVQTAIRWVKAHGQEFGGDVHRIALFGHSAGGHLAFLAATLDQPDLRVQAVVGLAPVTDFEQDLPQRGGLSPSLQALLDRPKEVTDESRQLIRSIGPINHVRTGMPPFLILQGADDKTVPFQQSLNFQTALKKSDVPATLITVEHGQHRVTDWDKLDPKWKSAMTSWLKTTFPPIAPTSNPSR